MKQFLLDLLNQKINIYKYIVAKNKCNLQYEYYSDNLFSFYDFEEWTEGSNFCVDTDFNINIDGYRDYEILKYIPNKINNLIYNNKFYDNFIKIFLENNFNLNKKKLKLYVDLLKENYIIYEQFTYKLKYNSYYDEKLLEFIIENKKKINLLNNNDIKILIENKQKEIYKYFNEIKKNLENYYNNINNFYIINNLDEQLEEVKQYNIKFKEFDKSFKFENIYYELKNEIFYELFIDAVNILNKKNKNDDGYEYYEDYKTDDMDEDIINKYKYINIERYKKMKNK